MGREMKTRKEYDFANGVRGKYAKRYPDGTNVIAIDPEHTEMFPDSNSVNEAAASSENWRDSFPERHPGVVLRGLRNRDDLTQAELAKKTGMLQSHISEMENGSRSIGKTIAKKFAQVFKTDYKVFL